MTLNCLNVLPECGVFAAAVNVHYTCSHVYIVKSVTFRCQTFDTWAILKAYDNHGNRITTGAFVTQLPLCDPIGKGRAAET